MKESLVLFHKKSYYNDLRFFSSGDSFTTKRPTNLSKGFLHVVPQRYIKSV